VLRKHHVHLELPKVKVATIKLFHDFQRLHLEDDIWCVTNAKTNTLCFFYSKEGKVGKFQDEKLANV
jgi:hypothetical protein